MSTMPKLRDFTDITFDPFAKIAQDHGAEDVADPYPRFAELRRQASVHEADCRTLFGFPGFYGNTGAPCFTVFRYDDVAQALMDGDTFSSGILRRVFGSGIGDTVEVLDGEEHRKYRRLFIKAFLPNVIAHWGATVVPKIIDRLVSRFEKRGKADLIGDFAALYPFNFIYSQFGLPDDEIDTFHKLSTALICFTDPEHMIEAKTKLGDYFRELLARRRVEPGSDLVSILAQAEIDGDALPEELLVSFLRQLIFAGGDTTYRLTGNLLFALLTHTDQFAALRNDRAKLLPLAIEEACRWECPATSIPRVATRDVVLGGVEIPAGGEVDVMFASANRDETVFENPDSFDLFRRSGRHFAFGYGPHVCIGQHLARLEVTRALEAVMDRLPNLRIDPDCPPPTITGLSLRSPAHLHVRFD